MSIQGKSLAALFGFTVQGANKWKREKEKRPIVSLLEKYFTEKELEEFLEKGEITSFSKIHSPVALRLEKLEEKQREQDEVIQFLKRELEKLQRPQYDKAGMPIPSGNSRK